MLSRVLRRPAAAEVRMMLQRIKQDNMERGRNLLAAKNNTGSGPDEQSVPFHYEDAFHRSGTPYSLDYSSPKKASIVSNTFQE